MTTFLLVRHAPHRLGAGTLAGRLPGVHLSDAGRAELPALVARLRDVPLDAVYAGPLDRVRETAEAVAAAHRLAVRVDEAFHEVDYGEWTGRPIERLDGDPRWRAWNERRGTARVPGGESMAEVRRRAVAGLRRLHAAYPDGHVAVVTHAEVVRAVLAAWLPVPLDDCLRIEVAPASIHVVTVAGGVPLVGAGEPARLG